MIRKIMVLFALVCFFYTNSAAATKNWESVNTDPFIGNLKHKPASKKEALSQAPLAVKLLGYPKPVQEMLLEKVKNDCGIPHFIRKGDFIPAMLAGKGKTLKDRVARWKNRTVPLPAIWYEVEWQGKKYVLVCPLICYNWIRGDKGGKILMRVPDVPGRCKDKSRTRLKKKDLSYIQNEGESVTADQKFAKKEAEDLQSQIVDQAKRDSREFLDEYWEHHPDAGIYAAQSELSRWMGAYVDYMVWQKRHIPELGFGIFAQASVGEMRISDYEWREVFLGVQVGVQHTWTDFVSNNLRQVQLKIRPGIYYQEGDSSGYSMHQAELGFDIYSEYAHQISYNTIGYLVANGFWDIANTSFGSTWSGDSPEDRSRIGVGMELNHYLNGDWDFRWGVGLSYTFWDEILGLTAFGKFKYQNTWSFGVNGMYPLLLGVYDGVFSASDLMWGGLFIQFEGGEMLLRRPDQKQRVNDVNKVAKR